MTMRRRMIRRRPIRRGGRRRTRWISITPTSILALANNTFVFKQLALEDRQGNIPYGDLYGDTVLRVILTITKSVTLSSSAPPQEYGLTTHFGVFAAPDFIPESESWDPNHPYGDFMFREQKTEQLFWQPNVFGGVVSYGAWSQMDWDVRSRRRLNENFALFLTGRHFMSGTGLIGVDYGISGRVLVALH